MYFAENSLDDLLLKILPEIIQNGQKVSASRGDFVEIRGALLVLRNPRARMSRSETKGTIFSCLGELLWYLAGAHELPFIQYYIPKYKDESDDGKTIYGAYGPRLFNMHLQGINQLSNVIELLRAKPTSRRAVVQLYDANDLVHDHKEVPCTCTLQFFIRDNKLEMLTHMRSNDAVKGFPHDVFAFTMLQEILARTLCLEPGEYKHSVGSLHIYDEDLEKAQAFIAEKYQANIVMPPMPQGDPWQSIHTVLKAEEQIRTFKPLDVDLLNLDNYWLDLITLLRVFRLLPASSENVDFDNLQSILHEASYRMFVIKRRESIERKRLANANSNNNPSDL